ncbi:NAD(P)-dependent oxidoreductase [Paraburkholderia sediminicola]|uniref:NAD(P)-dependent oxidoreductase n=1 Tax=Paraburkholderia sediminicola TaxID=458836 RepID=UPI0038BC54AC
MKQPQRIGFVGLGMMGAPMVRCLARTGFDVFVADADVARVALLASEQRITALSVASAEQVASLDVLITMLPNSAIVERVLLGEGGKQNDGWAGRLTRGAVVIDMSSSEPARSRDLAAMLAQAGLGYLDAPVSGGVKRAIEGKLAILVGGAIETLERCRTLFNAMGSSVLHIGAAGTGHAAKALNNYVSAAGLAATVEALHVAQRFGIDPSIMTDVLNASSGRSNTSENKVKQFMLNGTFASGFALQLMNKDLKIAHALADSVDYPMRLGDICVSLWNDAATVSTPTTDHTEMYRLLGRNS